MRWLLLLVLVVSGCGKSTPTMADIAEAIRKTESCPTAEELLSKVPSTPDSSEETRSGVTEWRRFPAKDGYVWVEVFDGRSKSEGVKFYKPSIQFSQTGKRE